MEELKLCPFCGNKEDIEIIRIKYIVQYKVVCNSCFCRTDVFDTAEEAVFIWNTRVDEN